MRSRLRHNAHTNARSGGRSNMQHNKPDPPCHHTARRTAGCSVSRIAGDPQLIATKSVKQRASFSVSITVLRIAESGKKTASSWSILTRTTSRCTGQWNVRIRGDACQRCHCSPDHLWWRESGDGGRHHGSGADLLAEGRGLSCRNWRIRGACSEIVPACHVASG